MIYDSQWDKEAIWNLERDGRLYQVYRSSGRLVSQSGQALLAYIARVHVWRDLAGAKLEVSLINTRDNGSIRLRSLFWHTDEAKAGPSQLVITPDGEQPAQGRFEQISYYSPATKGFSIRHTWPSKTVDLQKRAPLFLKAKSDAHTLLLHAPEAWQRHPSALGWEDGQWRGYFWPETTARALALPRGMAIHREFWLRETSATAKNLTAWDSDPIGIAHPQWWAQTEIIIPFTEADTTRFPFIEGKLSGKALLGTISDQNAEKIRAYGLFDYGDNHGDGGWGNLESFNDWSALVCGLRSSNEEALAIGLRGARHYRDIDMNQVTGACYTHSLNHISGSTSVSHAWPDGVAAHYLLTGSKRSQEMMLQHGEYLLTVSDRALARGLRTLGRYFSNLADVYRLTGDERFKKRFFEQVEISKQLLAEDKKNPDRSIFSYIGQWESRRLVPFHAWYGISALQKMESLTGDQSLSALIRQEIAATLNPELYLRDLKELWPRATPEEGAPLMLSDFSQQRGSFFYPAMTREAERHHRPEIAELALKTLYAWGIEGRGVRIQSILASTPLKFAGNRSEQELASAARTLIWNAAAETLLNGDFSLSPDYFHHWRPFPGKSLSHHLNWQRKRTVLLTLDEQIRKEGPRSLRFNLLPSGHQTSIKVDTHRFRLEKGKHRLKGWLRWDDGAQPPVIRVDLRDLDGHFGSFSVETGNQIRTLPSDLDAVKVETVTVAPPDHDGWRQLEITFDARQRVVANLYITCTIMKDAAQGHLWMDHFRMEP